MKRTYYLAFGYSDKWYTNYLRGYTHVAVVARSNGLVIGLEPLLSFCKVVAGTTVNLQEWNEILCVRVQHKRANNLFKLQFQTCATVAQYIMGINTGAILCQTLYNRLTKRKYPGVDVSPWPGKEVASFSPLSAINDGEI